jgi:four helix bundle protein
MKEYVLPFEKLEIWKLSVDLAVETYKMIQVFPKEEKYGLVSQITRAANSIGANIAEGSTRKSSKDKARFIEIAFGSAMELAHFTYLSYKLEIINIEKYEEFKTRILEVTNKINAYHNYIKKSIDS